ncbi:MULTISPECIES: hypothetical protein [Bacillus]|uniref:Uncharacterized protein n=1 Tax=Bacillus mycoides TaxID=1405 RepID=A0A1S9T8D0_BACMY|nr:hypothetical protein [Bacillus mycoides]EJS09165.1 hypothetical protein IKM_00340 [Bacillus mycoides]MDR4899916.1 hypothetical protein [Bacillus mycoides]MED0887486.1 hypothetical protein [Bacillus mycoides]MED0926986.1 hypothetical protein [Bacillus mycoides]MED0941417.1 hypothetical protein [Bacillus mycoides]
MANISEQKLNAPIENVKIAERDYIELAKELAKKIVELDPNGDEEGYECTGEELEQLREIRLKAVNDKDILKGDYVIAAYIDLYREREKFKGEGKYLKATDELIEKIFLNSSEKGNVVEFCSKHGISRDKYYRILKNQFKQEDDRERVERIRMLVSGR